MSKWPLVSIIIVNYNGKTYLQKCLDSLENTDYPYFEIIVADNNSTDGSKELLKELSSNPSPRHPELARPDSAGWQTSGNQHDLSVRHPDFSTKSKSSGSSANGKLSLESPASAPLVLAKPAGGVRSDAWLLSTQHDIKFRVIFNKENLGFAKANNIAAKVAQGKKLIFLNSDTLVEKNWLRELVQFSLKNSKIIVQPKILFWPRKNIIDNVGGIYRFPGFGFGRGHGELDQGQYNHNQLIDYANGTCFLIDKDFFLQLGGFDDNYFLHYEDVDLNLRAQKAGGQSWYCYKSVVYHKGSLTIRSHIKHNQLLYHIRKNQLVTIIKNFPGILRILRIFFSILIYAALTVKELIYYPKTFRTTLRAFQASIHYYLDYLLTKERLDGIQKNIAKKVFFLLDLGCGKGELVKLAILREIDAQGVDIKTASSQFHIISQSIEQLKTKQKFDVVSLYHVLEHTRKPKQILLKAKSFLKPNGILVIEVPLVGNFTEKFLQNGYLAYQDPTHRHFFTKSKITNLIQDAGLKIQNTKIIWWPFFFNPVTVSFHKNFFKGLLGLILFIPLKALTFLGFNTEIIRFYCKPISP